MLMAMQTHQELWDQVEEIEKWLKSNTAIDDARVRYIVLDMMLWLSHEGALQGKGWQWVLSHSRIHLASKRSWQTVTRKVRGQVGTCYEYEVQIRELSLPRNDNGRLADGVLADLERGYGLKRKQISRILRRASVGPAAVSPERARSHCLGRPQKRGESNPKWHFVVPPPLPDPDRNQLMLPSPGP